VSLVNCWEQCLNRVSGLILSIFILDKCVAATIPRIFLSRFHSLEHFDELFVHFGVHNITDRVVAARLVACQRPDSEVLANHLKTREESLEVGHFHLVFRFQKDAIDVLRNSVILGLVNFAECTLNGNLSVELGDDQVVDDCSCVVGVLPAWSRSCPEVAFKSVAAVEELADVLANIVLDDELAAGMMFGEFADVKHEFIKDAKLISAGDSLFKLVDVHVLLNFDEGLFFAKPSAVLALENCQKEDVEDIIAAAQKPAEQWGEVQLDASRDRNLG